MSKKNKVFVVSEYISSSQNTTGLYWEGVIKTLADAEISVEVVTVNFAAKSSFPKDVILHKVKKNVFLKKHFFNKLFQQLLISIKLFLMIAFKIKKGDVLLSGTNPTFIIPLFAFLKVIKNFKWTLCVHDVFPNNLIPLKIIGKSNLFYRVVSFIFKHAYLSVDKLIVIGRDMREVFLSLDIKDETIEVIQNWYDPSVLDVREKKESKLINNLGWSNKIVYQFFGNLGPVQGIEIILKAIDLIERDDIAFIFAGHGSSVPLLKEYINKNPKKNIVYYGAVSPEKKVDFLSACDIAIVSLIPGMKGLGVPSKAYFSLGSNRPLLVIGDDESELDFLLQEYRVGWFCNASRIEQIARTIELIDVEDINAHALDIRNVMIKNFSPDIALRKYLKVIRSLL